MTAPPDRLFYDPSSGQTFLTGPGVEYVPKAAIAAARAEGREQGLREARGIAHSLAVQNHELGFDDMKCGALEVVEHLDDLIPARPALEAGQ